MEKQIWISDRDLRRLEELVKSTRPSPSVTVIKEKLKNAFVFHPKHGPRSVVRMESLVRLKDMASSHEEEVTLAYPEDSNPEQKKRISILDPLGAALLGLSTGDVIEISLSTHETRRLEILSVLYSHKESDAQEKESTNEEDTDDVDYATMKSAKTKVVMEILEGWIQKRAEFLDPFIQAGQTQGRFMLWHDNGNKLLEGEWKDGFPHGRTQTWYPSGEPMHEVQLENGVWHGNWRMWSESGELLVTAYFEYGDEREWIEWEPNGQIRVERRDGQDVTKARKKKGDK